MNKYDFVVVGSGPSGQRAAIQAAKLGHTVAIIERSFSIGGACVHIGTIPSKTLREAVLYLTGWRQRGFYGRSYRVKERISAEDLMQRLDITIRHEIEQLMHKLSRNFVDTTAGRAEFEFRHTLKVEINDDETRMIEADRILIATGSRPVQPPNVSFDAPNVMDSDHIPKITEIPRPMVVVGAGVIGVEYASILSALDIDITLIDGRRDILGFLDREIVDEFAHHLRDRGVNLRLEETVESVDVVDDKHLVVHLASGKRVRANMALFASGRQSNTDHLLLENAGLKPDERGRLLVNEFFRTKVEHIYAAGDVIGFSALASTSMEQGRQASMHAFDRVLEPISHTMYPFGIYAVPEMSGVGKTEEGLREAGVPYESGTARFRETSRGQILGLREGLLKLLVNLDDRRLLGVHIVGEGATELIHIGQAVLAHNGSLDFFVDAVFNYPTLAETYKIAALDAWNKL